MVQLLRGPDDENNELQGNPAGRELIIEGKIRIDARENCYIYASLGAALLLLGGFI